jgi:hypothetical protein
MPIAPGVCVLCVRAPTIPCLSCHGLFGQRLDIAKALSGSDFSLLSLVLLAWRTALAASRLHRHRRAMVRARAQQFWLQVLVWV